MSERVNALEKMNSLGACGEPFLFIIDFEMNKPLVFRLNEIDKAEIFYCIGNLENSPSPKKINNNFIFKKYPVDKEIYATAFNTVQHHLSAGNTYLLNLTFPTRIETSLTMTDIFLLSRAKYKLLYRDKFVLFSPEPFVRIEKGKMFSFPMKGTIDAGIENAEAIILNDQKEIAEHNTIVDLIRNDLSMVAKNVAVDKFRYVEKIATHDKQLLQVSSQISGQLSGDYRKKLGEILFTLLPAGSISGAPKKKTLDIIKEVEEGPRNYYTGVFGIFDGKNLESAVMIRFIENVGGQLYFRSGGGITYQSSVELEYQELIDKVYVPIN